jgi:hypothetical protein
MCPVGSFCFKDTFSRWIVRAPGGTGDLVEEDWLGRLSLRGRRRVEFLLVSRFQSRKLWPLVLSPPLRTASCSRPELAGTTHRTAKPPWMTRPLVRWAIGTESRSQSPHCNGCSRLAVCEPQGVIRNLSHILFFLPSRAYGRTNCTCGTTYHILGRACAKTEGS